VSRDVGLLLLLLVLAAIPALDLAVDLREGASVSHLITEALAALAAFAGAAWVGLGLRRDRNLALVRLASTEQEAGQWRAEAARWRADAESAARGFGDAIDAEFERWGLSAAEREVALLLLKGLSHKEVAAARGTTERTARQQATTVYQKSGLAGRAELASYFLDALIPARGE